MSLINLSNFFTEYSIPVADQAYATAIESLIEAYLHSHNIAIHDDTNSIDFIKGWESGRKYFPLLLSNDIVEVAKISNNITTVLVEDTDYHINKTNKNYAFEVQLIDTYLLDTEQLKVTYKKGIASSTPADMQELIKQAILVELKNKNEKLISSNLSATKIGDVQHNFTVTSNSSFTANYQTILEPLLLLYAY